MEFLTEAERNIFNAAMADVMAVPTVFGDWYADEMIAHVNHHCYAHNQDRSILEKLANLTHAEAKAYYALYAGKNKALALARAGL